MIVAIIVVTLGIGGVIGYALATTNEPPAAPMETPSDTDAAQQPEPPKAPKVFEKDTQGLVPAAWLKQAPETLHAYTLKFPLEAFNRVEGEVTVKQIRDGVNTPVEEAWVWALVLDPHGNIVLQNALYSARHIEFPWRFSFVASTTGEHGLIVSTGGIQVMGGSIYVAHLKVTVYE